MNEQQATRRRGGSGEDFGAFVVECAGIVRSEVQRLISLGVRMDEDDGFQDGMQILLEERANLAGRRDSALVRTVLRRRLCNVHVRDKTAKKRNATMVSADEIAHAVEDAMEGDGVADGGDGRRPVDRRTIELMSVGSHENDVVDRVSMEECEPFIDYMNEPTSSAARFERRRRWLPKAKHFAQWRSAA